MEKQIITNMKKRCEEIFGSVLWLDFANRYFKKSSSWFYHKMNGIDGNGKSGGFTPEEAEQLRNGLYDLSERIRRCADSL